MSDNSFIFERYAFDAATGALRLHYAFENGARFEEIITFKPPFAAYDAEALDRVFRLLFLLAGVSYYKAYVPKRMTCKAFAVDRETAAFIEKVYTDGLGEFAYKNKLGLDITLEAADVAPQKPLVLKLPERALVPVGGGKDSIVTLEALKQAGMDVTLFALGGPAGAAQPIADSIAVSGLPSVFVSRVISPALIELNKTGVYNGHVPITAILSVIAVASCVLYGFNAVVMSNEHSASAPNLVIGGREVNHQYSKSFAFERDLAAYVAKRISPALMYFSFLRPCSEIDITRRFAKLDAYHGVFRSCNTAFRQDVTKRGTHWCCDCPKCRFVFLALAPFMDKAKLIDIFGRNMLDDVAQTEGFAELCGVAAYKPFECVGEVHESAAVIKKLSTLDAWKDDAVIKALAPKVEAGDFDMLFELYPDHALPLRYLSLLKGEPARVVIWGTGKEGRAAADFVSKHYGPVKIVFVDENPSDDPAVITDYDHMAEEVTSADMLVKSPGVSLYHRWIVQAQRRSVRVTSLLNLWMAHKPSGQVICVTGTKGKSTTSALLGHVLNALGRKAAVLGNIGVPVSEAPEGMDYLVLEMSSYQAADFDGYCDVAAVTSLYPEHLNWHATLDRYYGDKMNLLSRANVKIIHPQVREAWAQVPADCIVTDAVEAKAVPNDYLRRAHNLANVGVVLSIVKALGLDAAKALAAMHDFKGLAHRQQELGARAGVLFVDDSIATTPQAAIAAMDVYAAQPLTLIAGGYDRGIDYKPLVDYVTAKNIGGVIALGDSGKRIAEGLTAKGYKAVVMANDMGEAVKAGLARTPQGGVLLLSPAAPSFGMFRDYVARGEAFAAAAGFSKEA